MCRCGKCINVGRMCGWCPLTFTCHSITSETDICPTGEVGMTKSFMVKFGFLLFSSRIALKFIGDMKRRVIKIINTSMKLI